jgi:TPR repeat protein
MDRVVTAIEYYRSGPPGGRAMVRESYRWADEEGGVYGPGASVSTRSPCPQPSCSNGSRGHSPSAFQCQCGIDTQVYHELAWLDGNNTAQNMVGFMYATGIGGAVEPDQAIEVHLR